MNLEFTRHKDHGISFLKGGNGKPFLLLHGIPGSAFSWEQAGLLLGNHYQVIIPDLLGFGESDFPQGDYYMEQQARAIRELLRHLGVTSLYLGGHDFGGPVALTLMRLFPDLEIRGLVLSDTNVFVDTYIPPPLRIAKVPLLGKLFFKVMAGNLLGMWMMYQQAFKNKSQTSWKQFEKHLTPGCLEFTSKIFQRSLADLKKNYQDIEEFLPRIGVPTLVLWGTLDPFFAVSVGERTHTAIKNSAFEVYAHTGHFVPEEMPADVARDIINFFGTKDKI